MDIQVYVHPSEETQRQLDRIERLVRSIIRMGVEEMAKIDDLTVGLAEQTTVIAGVGVFIQNLRDQIANGATPAQLDAALAGLQGNTTQLGSFIENTPAVQPDATEPIPA